MSSPFNPYAELHQDTSGPGDKRPTALQVVEDLNLIQKWSDKVVLITGATSGIGIETTRAIYATGARVFVMVRDTAKVQPIVADILKTTKGSGNIEVIAMDLESLESVKGAAKEFLKKSSQLNVLINNAGIMACPKAVTVDGFERQFGVNYLAHFTLTTLLLPLLLTSATPSFNSRVIWVTSTAHRHASSKPDLDNIGMGTSYERWAAYGQSKTAMVWAANYMDRVYGPRGVHAVSVHPGGILTNLAQYLTQKEISYFVDDEDQKKMMKNAEQGAATQVWAAVAPVWEGTGGKYLEDCRVAEKSSGDKRGGDSGYGEHAYDKESEERLWEVSAKMAGVEAP
ncbi:putative short-chain dehydrogenase [Nemania sp. FL0916]|nr:putative short-chain dehydrogenase [Nemania sp. FL0916]